MGELELFLRSFIVANFPKKPKLGEVFFRVVAKLPELELLVKGGRLKF